MIIGDIKNYIEINNPKKILDVGCGDGKFTESIHPVYEFMVAGDREIRFFTKKTLRKSGIKYLCFNALMLPFRDDEFDVVYARAVLHHEKRWENLLDEMFRTSKNKVIIEEPFEDRRSEEKSNTYDAMEFLLKLQNEAGYQHYRYFPLSEYDDYFGKRKVEFLKRVIKNDNEISFYEIFRNFEKFADKSMRRDFWYDEFEKLKNRFSGKVFSDDDLVIIHAEKKGSVFDGNK